MNRVIVLGSTGSIGQNTLSVVDNLEDFKVVGLATFGNYQLLLKQAIRIKPQAVTIINQKHHNKLKESPGRIKSYAGEDGLLEMIDEVDADTIVCALSSSIGIHAILRAIEKGMRICLATKEILVSFGDIIMDKAKKSSAQIVPIDSEHSAIFQCLQGRNRKEIRNIILTASGGPFLKKSIAQVKKRDVLNHPVWKMGNKITVDSATMMNKGLEVIEAHHLFSMPSRMIRVVIHPEAICHSLVQFIDGTMLAQLSTPDMRLPIQYALTLPERRVSLAKYLDIKDVKQMTFQPPNHKKFPCLGLAYQALEIGRSMPAVLNAANAEAVNLFLEEKVKFHEIPKLIQKVMAKHTAQKGDINDYIKVEAWARNCLRSLTC